MSTTAPLYAGPPASSWSELAHRPPAPRGTGPVDWLDAGAASARVLSPRLRADAPVDADGWAARLVSHLIEADPPR